jgi:hypothetical protein
VTNIIDTSVVGFRYLTFDGKESRLTARVRGNCQGELSVFLSDEDKDPAGTCPLCLENEAQWTQISVPVRATQGDRPLRLFYRGSGSWELADVQIQ